jgi:hypothetical protein
VSCNATLTHGRHAHGLRQFACGIHHRFTNTHYHLGGFEPKVGEFAMKKMSVLCGFGMLCLAVSAAHATGLATCDSGPKSGWQPVEKLEQQLKEKGYVVRRVKEDGGCYEVYALNEKGERGEYYFHPVTLAPVPIKAR